MTQRDESDSNGKRVVIGIPLRPADLERLEELAREAGMSRAALASALILELLPTITGVRMRLQIIRKEPVR